MSGWWSLSVVAILATILFFAFRRRNEAVERESKTIITTPIFSNTPTVERRLPPLAAGPHDYEIEYVDAQGEITLRRITVRSVALEPASGAIFLECFCHLRNSSRTFRADRIRVAFRAADRRLIPDPTAHFTEMAPSFGGGLRWWGGMSPADLAEKKVHDRVMARARPGLAALVWLAAADGEVSEPEIEVMFGWIGYRAAAGRMDDGKWSRDAARQWIREARPTFAEIRGGLVGMGVAEAREFRSTLEALAVADGEKDRLEVGRIERITACLP